MEEDENVYGRLSPDIHRALARELYVDSTVNVVNPTGRRSKSPSKVKPGQMNLFHPVAPRAAMESELQAYIDNRQEDRSPSGSPNRSPERFSHRENNLVTLSNIIKEDSGNNVKMKNRVIQEKTDEV